MSNGRPPKTVGEWVRYLHIARAVPQDSPDYPQAQEAVRFALQRIRTMNTVANAQDQPVEGTGRAVGPGAAAGVGLMHGLSFGAGEPIAGLLAALVPGGQGFREGAQQYRQGLENVGLDQPIATPAGEMSGLALQSLLPIAQGVQAGTRTAAAIPSVRANMLARFGTGMGQANVTTPAVLGGIAGFSAGGEDPGDLGARFQGAGVGAGLGAAGAALLGGLGALRVPRWLSGVKREMRAALPKNTPPNMVEGMTDSAIRQQLQRQGYDAPTQERILGAWRAGKTDVPPPPPPPPPPTLRPGETITPIAPKGFAVTGPRAMPSAGPYPPSIAEMQGLSPRGVGGHSYTGTYPAGMGDVPGRTMPSSTHPGSQAMQLQQLQMLAQMPEAEFQSVAGLFPQEVIQQLRTIRAQFGLGGP